MIKKHALFIALLTTFIIQLPEVVGQDLNLFQATDNPDERQTTTRTPQQRRASSTTEPAFTLVGTSRFGDQYFVSLLSRNNESVWIEWTQGRVKEIEGYLEFDLVQVNARSVSIRHSDSEPCIDNGEKGVKCNGNIAVLTLSNAKPMSPTTRQTEPESTEIGNSGTIVQSDGVEEPITIGNTSVLTRNPFSGELQEAPDLTTEEISSREARRQQRAEQFRNFEIVRIAEEEIPEGMQRIRTPFGDRLEPDEN
jgi:hypothetical protein